eukprot:g7726.t1
MLCLTIPLLATLSVATNNDSNKDMNLLLNKHLDASTKRRKSPIKLHSIRKLLDDDKEEEKDEDDDKEEDEEDDKKEKRRRKYELLKRVLHRRRRSRLSGDSSSLTELRGVLRIIVIGNGDMCFVKIFQNQFSYREQYGNTTTTSAFLDLYGHGECEPGARGIASGIVRAGVMAEAHQRGPQCEATVTSYVIAQTRDLDPNDGVSVAVGGAAGGEALADCP